MPGRIRPLPTRRLRDIDEAWTGVQGNRQKRFATSGNPTDRTAWTERMKKLSTPK